jgi:hypothetical protein
MTIPVNCWKLSIRSLWLDSMDIVMHEIMTSFYISSGLNDMDPIMIVLYSHMIWFTIDCIHGIVLLRFDSILCQLEKQSSPTLSRLHSFDLV